MSAAPLSHIPAGTPVFLDANILVYGLLGQSQQCIGLLRRCATEDVFGVTSLHVINEATHTLMLHEALAARIIAKYSARLLKKRARRVTELAQYWLQVERIFRMNLVVLRMEEAWLHRAHSERAQCGLLTNDSLIVAAMREYGLARLASNDGDFDRVLGVTRYFPSDLPLPAQ